MGELIQFPDRHHQFPDNVVRIADVLASRGLGPRATETPDSPEGIDLPCEAEAGCTERAVVYRRDGKFVCRTHEMPVPA